MALYTPGQVEKAAEDCVEFLRTRRTSSIDGFLRKWAVRLRVDASEMTAFVRDATERVEHEVVPGAILERAARIVGKRKLMAAIRVAAAVKTSQVLSDNSLLEPVIRYRLDSPVAALFRHIEPVETGPARKASPRAKRKDTAPRRRGVAASRPKSRRRARKNP